MHGQAVAKNVGVPGQNELRHQLAELTERDVRADVDHRHLGQWIGEITGPAGDDDGRRPTPAEIPQYRRSDLVGPGVNDDSGQRIPADRDIVPRQTPGDGGVEQLDRGRRPRRAEQTFLQQATHRQVLRLRLARRTAPS
ncbi:hypothetical protein GCM10023176_61550 [Micromonospora coerulea]|uniref:Uncharacterized protein n=1 Tax=Micromonospora coerulea TaxID=47856 RepID=A0ABP8T3X1_9ACTN